MCRIRVGDGAIIKHEKLVYLAHRAPFSSAGRYLLITAGYDVAVVFLRPMPAGFCNRGRAASLRRFGGGRLANNVSMAKVQIEARRGARHGWL